jgi:hypothetical protein
MRRTSWFTSSGIAFLIVAGATGFAFCAGPSAPPASAPATPAASRDGWPETPAGAVARRWVEAFSKGDEAMRRCLSETLTPESLAERSLDVRMDTYRENHDRFGTLTLATVDASAPGELKVTLLAADLSKHTFVFKAQTEAPYKLISVGRIETRMMSHFGHP